MSAITTKKKPSFIPSLGRAFMRGINRVAIDNRQAAAREAHAKTHCVECNAEIGPGKPGRKCKKCREAVAKV